MKYDIDTIRNNKIELLDCQVELVLKSLKFYCYSANFLYNRSGKYTTRDDELQISMITDTYNQISKQFVNSKINNKITNKIFTLEEEYKKIS